MNTEKTEKFFSNLFTLYCQIWKIYQKFIRKIANQRNFAAIFCLRFWNSIEKFMESTFECFLVEISWTLLFFFLHCWKFSWISPWNKHENSLHDDTFKHFKFYTRATQSWCILFLKMSIFNIFRVKIFNKCLAYESLVQLWK